ncbi:MAG: hypothetical protein M3N97_16495 [Pseudomonadota bacterium]|nr:hypothetical protein [Pseudomonadota bacterium]
MITRIDEKWPGSPILALVLTLSIPVVGDAQSVLTSDHIRLLIEGRIAERLVILGAAILLLTFGFLSLRSQAAEKGMLEATAQHLFSLKLRNVGPGIFFSLFGAALLLLSVNTKLDLQFPPSVNKPPGVMEQKASTEAAPAQGVHVSYGVGMPALSDTKERRHFLAALLTAERLTATNRQPLSKTEMAALARSIQTLEPFKAAIVDSEAGSLGAYQWWQTLKRDPRFGSSAFEDQLSDQEKNTLHGIEQIEKDALGESQ